MDLFGIDQCLYTSADVHSSVASCNCRYFDVVIHILSVPMSSRAPPKIDVEDPKVETSSNDGSTAIYALATLALLPIFCLISFCFWKKGSTDIAVDETRRNVDDSAAALDEEQQHTDNSPPNEPIDETELSIHDENCTISSQVAIVIGISTLDHQEGVEHHPMDKQ